MAAVSENPLFEELLWVHAAIRRDLETVKALARDTDAGAAPEQIHTTIATLRANGPLWQLKVNCLHYCRFVHQHHRLEDAAVFPAIRRADPSLDPVVDKLEADHRQVAVELAEVEAAAEALVENDCGETRERVAASLDRLAGHLLEHLAFEEQSLEPVLAKMGSWSG